MEQKLMIDRPLILVGLMGAGKTSVGRRLAKRLNLPFCDADEEIVKAAGCSIEDIFELYGEEAFRDGERKVIIRLLDKSPKVLATGGGAFIDDTARKAIKENGISIWLRVPLDTLVMRTENRGGRPLLKDQDVPATLKTLMEKRYPIYETADIVIDAVGDTPDDTAEAIIKELERYLSQSRTQ
jgi:shikimate kinase